MILHTMTFVNDHVLPLDLGKHGLVFDDVFIGSEKDIEIGAL